MNTVSQKWREQVKNFVTILNRNSLKDLNYFIKLKHKLNSN